MVRTWSVILGLGLIILWIAGLSTPYTSAWLTWLDGAAAVIAFIVAAGASGVPARERGAASGAIVLSLGLFALWIAALVTANTVAWLTWWTFGFACAFLIVGIAGAARSRPVSGTTTGAPVNESERERFRKSA